jgi:hypothetical protein
MEFSRHIEQVVVVVRALAIQTKRLFGAPEEVSYLLLGEAPLASDQMAGEQPLLSPAGNGRDAYAEAVSQIGLGAELASGGCRGGKAGGQGRVGRGRWPFSRWRRADERLRMIDLILAPRRWAASTHWGVGAGAGHVQKD